jgi:hypothetical protein
MTLGGRAYKALHEHNAIQRFLSRKAFPYLERLGFHLVGDHFYEPIPDTRTVRAAYRDEPREHLRIDFGRDQAEARLVSLVQRWGAEFPAAAHGQGYEERNHYFFGVDALALYAFVRETRPARVVEIGHGASTRVLSAALERNAREDGRRPRLFSIDPYARPSVAGASPAIRYSRVRTQLQQLEPDVFAALEGGDLLFVDSSHVYKFGSDVEYLFERAYPALRPAVNVHIHDIFTPFHYPLEWYLRERRFWNEQQHLEQLLRADGSLRVVAPVHYLVRTSERLRAACAEVAGHGFRFSGSSFYFTREGP